MSEGKVKYYAMKDTKKRFESYNASEVIQWAIDNGATFVGNYR